MTLPTPEEYARARSLIDARGKNAPETTALAIAALRDPNLGDILDKQIRAAIEVLRTPHPETLRGILTGVFISGLNIGLTVRDK
jgi:hypothetical protein